MKSHLRTSQRKPSRRTRASLSTAPFIPCLLDCVLGAGQILLRYFGHAIHPRQKENASSIVCDADLAAERFILKHIRARFPHHNIVSEESGRAWQTSEYTWVVDPLDGTSNFVAGIPWFGVQIALLRGRSPIVAAMYLPTENALYFAEAGRGAWRNRKRIHVTAEPKLQNVLCAFAFDPVRTPDAAHPRARATLPPLPEGEGRGEGEQPAPHPLPSPADLLFRVSSAVRNTRATNSLVDFCYTADGRLGGCINLKTKIWDIAPMHLILPEAGGKFTHLDGSRILLQLDAQAAAQNYAVLGASTRLHGKLLTLTSRSPPRVIAKWP